MMWNQSVASTLVCLVFAGAAWAQPGPVPPDVAAAVAAAKAGGDEKDKDKPDFPKFDEVMKGFEAVRPIGGDPAPFLSLWYNKKTDQLFAQVPNGLVGKRFLIAVSVAGGPFFTGFQLDHWLAYLERMDKQLVLMRVDSRYAADDNAPVSDVVKRSYTDEIVRTIQIRTMKDGDPIIDLGELFKADFAGIGPIMRTAVNAALSRWSSWKTFAKNTEIGVDLAMGAARSPMSYLGGGGGDTPGTMGRRMRMHYSLSAVPQSDYKPRVADNRIGYFMTVRYDWGKKYDTKSLFNRYITRWNLKKQDESLEMSPPVRPIRWYVEKTVPVRWRRYVVEGIAEWNRAFEKCGFVNAVQVLQQTDTEYADLDPEDVRYNFFRWIVTGNSFAMGPSRDHPLTGEILDADIVFDDSMVRVYVTEYERLTGGSSAWGPLDPFMSDFFKAHPRWDFQPAWRKLLPNVQIRPDREAELMASIGKLMAQRGRPLCDYAAGKAQELALARIQLEAKGMSPKDNEEFLGQVVKEIVMHEVGHCLGLRHNFKASAWKSIDEIAKSDSPTEATIGSVMDYNPNLFAIRGEKQGSYIPRTLGPYDHWAIEYGYRVPGKDDKNEDEMLKKIAGRVAEEGLDYATDEDTMGVLSADPFSNRFDCGNDPVAYAERQIKLTTELLSDVTKWGVKDGESYSRLRRTFTRLVAERSRVAFFVARMVGGQIVNRDQKGDPNARPPIVPVSAEKQKAAREFIIKNVFAEDAYRFDPELLNQLAPGRYWHWDSDDFDMFQEFNIHEMVAAGQWRSLFTMMNPFTIIRIHDGEAKFAKGETPYTLADHIESLTGAIWSELSGGGGRMSVNSFRRNLQRMHLRMLMALMLDGEDSGIPADAGAICRLSAAELSEKIGRLLEKGDIEAATRAHLVDSKKRIDKALEAQYLMGVSGAGGGRSVMRPAEPDGLDEGIIVLPER